MVYVKAKGHARPIETEEVTEENVFDVPDRTESFFPGQIMADLTVSFILLVVVVALAYILPTPLTEPMDISTFDYVPRPEWFFFFYDQMLIFFPGYALIPFGGIVIPALFAMLMFAVPWIDTEPVYSPAQRPFMIMVSLLVVLVVAINLLLGLSRILNFTGGSPAG